MTSNSKIKDYHHIQLYVSNALQASFWYCYHFGFERFAQRHSPNSAEIAIRNGPIIIIFKSPITPADPEGVGKEIAIHGDFVKDVAYVVDNLDVILECLLQHGHHLLQSKKKCADSNGSLFIARITGSAGSIVHTLVQNIDYVGPLMPGFKSLANFPACHSIHSIMFLGIDHVVEAHPEHSLESAVQWYQRMLGMRRFWSIDDKLVHAEFSALRAILVGNNENGGSNGDIVKVTLVEPVTLNGQKRKGQVQEFIDFHGQSGIQHIAFTADNIIGAVEELTRRGVQFLDIPDAYYDLLERRLQDKKLDENSNNVCPQIKEDLARIRQLGILMDFDEHGYLLQIFTKPVQDRATLFLEIIQRHNFNGFGAGNFKALFAAVELEQKRREAEMAENCG